MKSLFSKKTAADVFRRYASYYAVIALTIVLMNTLFFFLFKMDAAAGDAPFYVGFRNNMIVEMFACILGPIFYVAQLLGNGFSRAYSDTMSSLPVKRSGRVGAYVGLLLLFLGLQLLLGVITDVVLRILASDGFEVNAYLLRKNTVLCLLYLLFLGISLFAYAVSSGFFEYFLYSFGFGGLVSISAVAIYTYRLEKLHAVTDGVFSMVIRGVTRLNELIYRFPGMFLGVGENEVWKGILIVLVPIVLVVLVVGIVLFYFRPSERTEGMNRCLWSRILALGMVIGMEVMLGIK